MLTEHAMKSIEMKDAVAASDAPAKGKHIGGTWIIGVMTECETQEDSTWSN